MHFRIYLFFKAFWLCFFKVIVNVTMIISNKLVYRYTFQQLKNNTFPNLEKYYKTTNKNQITTFQSLKFVISIILSSETNTFSRLKRSIYNEKIVTYVQKRYCVIFVCVHGYTFYLLEI